MEVTCKLCNGTKIDPRKKGGKTPCPKCGGRGKVNLPEKPPER